MKLPTPLHLWSLSPTRAVSMQKRLAARVHTSALSKDVRLVAGADCAFVESDRIIACWVVWDISDGTLVEKQHVVRAVRFPYVPGLLSFREAPALIAAARKLRTEPHVFMVDGHGLAHPRRFGLACHLGLFLGRPTMGCAKSRLCGVNCDPADRRGAIASLTDREGEIGRVVRTQRGVRPVYVSIGHLITLDDAVRLTLESCTKFRLPEPTRLAHAEVSRLRRSLSLEIA